MAPLQESSAGAGANRSTIGLGVTTFSALVADGVLDLVVDVGIGASSGHILGEVFFIVAALVANTMVWSRFLGVRSEAQVLALELGEARAEAESWRREAYDVLRGLAVAIERTFDRWKLSASERELALLLLKGLPEEQIAEQRRATGREIREQASEIYRKSGLTGRAELLAFFVDDLLPAKVGHQAAG
jgi:DNA-binding CsgD family transcriptional regulator